MNELEKIKQLVQSWLNKQGHDRCWYYPEIFQQIAEILNIDIEEDQKLPSLLEFREGCRKFQEKEYKLASQEIRAYSYEVFYCVAEFGEDYVTIAATSQEEADSLIDEWCKNNNCVDCSGGQLKPRFIRSGRF